MCLFLHYSKFFGKSSQHPLRHLPWDEQAACSTFSDPMGAACHAMPRLQTHPSLDGSAMQPHISPGSQHSAEKLLYLLSGIPRPCLHPKGQLPRSWTGQALSVGSALPARPTFSSHISFPGEINNNSRGSALQRRWGCGLRQVQNAPTLGGSSANSVTHLLA